MGKCCLLLCRWAENEGTNIRYCLSLMAQCIIFVTIDSTLLRM